MAKAQDEVREAFNGKSKIGEADIQGLSYLRLVIKEALRLHTPAPLLIPRVCHETCKIMGYDVPKGMGTNYEFLPFGAGRRICPGINLGMGNIDLALASLLYHFDWKLPDGVKPKDVDVCEAAGIVGSKKTSLIVHPVTRIPPSNV
ncbi:hypothetical protein HU200_016754 [Digitaria exilis]|uniref:Cytochrome P450 n=1 Tax=Digitaria exilis TaxID=1010633 RepID=A0A835F7M4_9POAL|nr:hypothetical protein HU200_016754 [Digitaria exilis]